MQTCINHTGLTQKVEDVAADVGEIKSDVKALLASNAADRSLREVGRAFALGLGALTPLSALAWAIWGN